MQRLLPRAICALLLMGSLASPGEAETYFVTVDGQDRRDRDGLSREAAWASLAYACERVPQGQHTIRMGPGEYTATRTASPASGITIVGSGRWGDKATRIVASSEWPLVDLPHKDNPANEYLIAAEKRSNLAIRQLSLASQPTHRITGGVRCVRCEGVNLDDVGVEEFRWAGLHFELSKNIRVYKCNIRNASTNKSQYWGGLIRTRYLEDSTFDFNRITSDIGGGYGYKGSGHTNVRLHHNFIEVNGGFSVESAHENEYGLEIDHNHLTGCISVPKGGQGADPNSRGFEYSVWVHHNYLTDSYTIEGPRNHLRVDHNHIHIEKPNGRVYTHHGGTNHGPVWIHHNVIENVDRSLVWMNQGLAENIFVSNNTVFLADAGGRASHVIDAYTADRLNNWVIKNNIFVAAWSQPRSLMPTERGVPGKMTVENNLCINLTNVPEGNHQDTDPGLIRSGKKPWEFYQPAGPGSFVVDRGQDVGLPFVGDAPEIGAVELGAERPEWKVPQP